MQLTKDTVIAINKDIAEAVAAVAAKHGVAIAVGSSSYSSESATTKLNITTLSPDGKMERPEAKDFRKMCRLYGFEPSDLGRQFPFNGGMLTIVGLCRRGAYRILCQDSKGRLGRLNDATVRHLLGK